MRLSTQLFIDGGSMFCRCSLAVLFLLVTGCQNQEQLTGCLDPSYSVVTSPLSESDLNRLDSPPRNNRLRERQAANYLESHCTDFHEQEISSKDGNNLICHIRGKNPDRIVVGAHYDHTVRGAGVVDNWTGIVLISRLAAELVKNVPNYSWEIVAFGAEEDGMLGSKSYLRQDAAEGNIVAMINVDSLGLAKVNVDSRSDRTLGCIANDMAEVMKVDVSQVTMTQTMGDWQPFKTQGIAVLNMHSLTRQTLSKVHTRKDRRNAVIDKNLQDAWHLLLNIQRYLDYGLAARF